MSTICTRLFLISIPIRYVYSSFYIEISICYINNDCLKKIYNNFELLVCSWIEGYFDLIYKYRLPEIG